MTDIHPTAVVEPGADLASDVTVGPYCVVGEHSRLGLGVRLHSHVVVQGRTTIGEGTEIYPFASIGTAPQDLKYQGEPSTLVIGARNRIREHVTMNPGTEGGGMTTRVGDDGLFMMGAHVAHDCVVGDHVIMANNATLAGHVVVGDFAIIGGLSAVHQFVRIGDHAMIGGMSGVDQDVIPYGSVMGDRARLHGLNIVGMKRRRLSKEDMTALRQAYKMLFKDRTGGVMEDRINRLAQEVGGREIIGELLSFVQAESSRGLSCPADSGNG